MLSKANKPTAVVIAFPTSKKAAPRTEADLARVSADAEIYELCRDIVLNRPEKMHKRRYRSIRIPRAVYERVVRRLSIR